MYLLLSLIRSALFAVLLALPCTVAMSATPPTFEDPEGARILHIGHLNFDCIEDTVLGTPIDPSMSSASRPYAIAWGQRNGSKCPGDSGVTHHGIGNEIVRVARTRIQYPIWKDLSCNVSFQEVNGDSLPDIIFFLRGGVFVGDKVQDSSRVIVLFGQKWLDTVGVVNLGNVLPFQQERFFALDLHYGRDIVEPEVRDISGIRSHRLLPVALNVFPDSVGPRSAQEAGPTLEVRVHPNPAIESAQIEARHVPPGSYIVEIVAVNGEVQWKREVIVSASGELLRTLDLHSLASGAYLVRLQQQDRIHATHPIIITR